MSDDLARLLGSAASWLRVSGVDLLVPDDDVAADGDAELLGLARAWVDGGATASTAGRVVGDERVEFALVPTTAPPAVLAIRRPARPPRPAAHPERIATLAALVGALLDGADEPDEIGDAATCRSVPTDELDEDDTSLTDDRGGVGRRVLATALATAGQATVFAIGIDRLAVVNEVLGRRAGDLVLDTARRRVADWAGPGAEFARLSGSRFGVVHPGVRDLDAAVAAAAQLRDLLAAPVDVAGLSLSRSVSIGLAVGPVARADNDDEPDPPAAAERTVAHAVRSLFAARDAGGDSVRTYDAATGDERLGRLQLELELDGALRAGELRLFYQPEFDLLTGDLLAVEALLRWEHPRLGLVRADAFVDDTERTRTFAAVQLWVVEEACRQLATWRAKRGGSRLGLRINVSAWQIARGDVAEAVLDTVAKYGLAPHSVCIELTERRMPRKLSRISAPLDRLSSAGVSIAVDDFGTGEGTISALMTLPIDTIKIDQSFVTAMREDPRAEAVVAGIIALAASLSLETVAEGVDGADTVARLVQLGCRRGQGNSLGEAMPAGEVEQFLRQ